MKLMEIMRMRSFEYFLTSDRLINMPNVQIKIPPTVCTSTLEFGLMGWQCHVTQKTCYRARAKIRFFEPNTNNTITFRLNGELKSTEISHLYDMIRDVGLTLGGRVPNNAWTNAADSHSYKLEIDALLSRIRDRDETICEFEKKLRAKDEILGDFSHVIGAVKGPESDEDVLRRLTRESHEREKLVLSKMGADEEIADKMKALLKSVA